MLLDPRRFPTPSFIAEYSAKMARLRTAPLSISTICRRRSMRSCCSTPLHRPGGPCFRKYCSRSARTGNWAASTSNLPRLPDMTATGSWPRRASTRPKVQLHNAWFYYLEARSLISPLPFMSTLATDKLYDESQKPAAGGLSRGEAKRRTFRPERLLTSFSVFPEAVGNDLDLIVRYQTAASPIQTRRIRTMSTS